MAAEPQSGGRFEEEQVSELLECADQVAPASSRVVAVFEEVSCEIVVVVDRVCGQLPREDQHGVGHGDDGLVPAPLAEPSAKMTELDGEVGVTGP